MRAKAAGYPLCSRWEQETEHPRSCPPICGAVYLAGADPPEIRGRPPLLEGTKTHPHVAPPPRRQGMPAGRWRYKRSRSLIVPYVLGRCTQSRVASAQGDPFGVPALACLAPLATLAFRVERRGGGALAPPGPCRPLTDPLVTGHSTTAWVPDRAATGHGKAGDRAVAFHCAVIFNSRIARCARLNHEGEPIERVCRERCL